MIKTTIKNLLNIRTSSEALLLISMFAALIVANTSFYGFYHEFFNDPSFLKLSFLDFDEEISFNTIINDFLMAIFFLLVGLELKREILVGELSSKTKIILPIVGAIGGTLFPAIIFSLINQEHAENLRGFAIPTATDIVFTYVVVKMFSNKISSAAKVFLITLAVVDDLIAIAIIAIFYTADLQIIYLFFALMTIGFLAFLNYKKSDSIFSYSLGGFLLWLCILQSGIHPSVAGVIFAMFIPLKLKDQSPLKKLALDLAPIVNFVILPLFAFANTGVRISGLSWQILFDSLVMGIACGLFFGKQIGVTLFGFVAIKLKLCHLPRGSSWVEFYCLAILTGIGFTMSLFVGNLAFDNAILLDKVKIGVLIGSIASAVVGSIMLYMRNEVPQSGSRGNHHGHH